MDIISHGLWGGIAFGRKNKFRWRLAFLFGIAPDLLSFGIFFVERVFTHGFDFQSGPPDPSTISSYVYQLYNVTHSLVVFTFFFAFFSLFLGRTFWEMAAWGLHIILDIFTHSNEFFPTPFLWPLSDYKFDGMPWSHPYIFFTNVAALVILYLVWWWKKRRKKAGHILIDQL